MGKFLKILFNILLTIIIIILLAYFGLRAANIVKIYNVETGSMEDKIHAGDYILMYKKKNYYVGDIVTFRVDDYFVTHRIVDITGNKVTTKGDANNAKDDKISFDQIEGKAIYWGGFLNIIINYKYLLVAFLIGIYLLSCYFESRKEKLENNNDKINDNLGDNIKEETDKQVIKQKDTSLIDEKFLDNNSKLAIESKEENKETTINEDNQIEEKAQEEDKIVKQKTKIKKAEEKKKE